MRQFKNPKSLVERLTELHITRKALEAEADALKDEETALLTQALGLFEAKGLSNLALDSGHKVVVTTQPIATIVDWPTLLADVAKHAADRSAFEKTTLGEQYQGVIHRRVSPTQLEALAHEKRFVGGVVLDHKKVAVFSAPRGKRDAE